jgi:translation initiation factor IF-3
MVVAPRARRAGLFSFAAPAASGAGPAGIVSRHSAAGDSRGSDGTQGGHISAEPRINERIRVPEVRLVGPAGEQVGIVSIDDALRLAQEADLDLVEVAPTARPPVCKLMDYGKFKYESALKARESRKNQAQTVIKEIKLRPKIDPHDYGTKKGHVERFLKAGDKVKVTIMFRGREQSRPELGFRLLQRLAGDVEELGFVETSAKQDGRNMTMVIGPHRRKSEGKAERAPQGDHDAQEDRAPQPARASHSQAARAAHDQAVQAARPAPSQPAPAPASAPQSEPAEPARAPQSEPARAPRPAQSEPARAARPAQSEPARAARPAQSEPARAPRPAPSQPTRAARPAPSQPARPSQSARPSQPAPQSQPAQPGQPAPQPAERAPAARPVPGPRAVAAASATRRANGGQQGTRQPDQEVSTS